MKTLEENNHSAHTLNATDLGLRNPLKLSDRLVAKIDSLDTDNFTERRLGKKARVLSDLVRDAGEGTYPMLSMMAYTETVVGLLKFIKVEDEVRDTLTNGLDDDMRRLSEICATHRVEIERYLTWRRARG
jgi:hypothetical protein